MHDNHTLRHIPYLIAKPDSLAVLLLVIQLDNNNNNNKAFI